MTRRLWFSESWQCCICICVFDIRHSNFHHMFFFWRLLAVLADTLDLVSRE